MRPPPPGTVQHFLDENTDIYGGKKFKEKSANQKDTGTKVLVSIEEVNTRIYCTVKYTEYSMCTLFLSLTVLVG